MGIRRVTADEFFEHPDCQALLAEYAGECANAELPPINPDRQVYAAMERHAMLHLLAAFEEEAMVGLLFLLVHVNPHYSVKLAVTESWFVAAKHRSTGAGLELYRRAKSIAAALGARGIYVSAPLGGQLADVMQAMRARETNRVFFEVLQ